MFSMFDYEGTHPVVFYGLAGARDNYRPVAYRIETYGNIRGVKHLRYIASTLRAMNPTIESVYMVDNRYGLRGEYMTAYKNPSIENCAIFKDTLEREGVIIKNV